MPGSGPGRRPARRRRCVARRPGRGCARTARCRSTRVRGRRVGHGRPTLRSSAHEHPHRRRAGRRSRPSSCCPATRCGPGGSPRRSSRTRSATPRSAGCSASPAPDRGEPVSVQGSGMGQPSLAIYVNELFREYDVQPIVRVGSCGALTEDLALRDLVIASGACTDSSMNRIRFEGLDYAPVADFGLLRGGVRRRRAARPRRGGHVGLIFSSDSFYSPRPELIARMVELRRARGRDGGQRALHARRPARPPRAGDLHGLRPHRHRRGDHRRRSARRPSARWSRSRSPRCSPPAEPVRRCGTPSGTAGGPSSSGTVPADVVDHGGHPARPARLHREAGRSVRVPVRGHGAS